jgi:hypothetical protein
MHDGRKEYVIQQRHWLVHWWWVDAWINSWVGAACCDSFPTLDEAQRNLCFFDGTPTTERVIPNDKLTGQQKQEKVETMKKRFVTIAGTVRRMVSPIVERIRHPGAAICFNCGRTFAPRFARLKARFHKCKHNDGGED